MISDKYSPIRAGVRLKHSPRRALAKSRKPPTCWAETKDGRACTFPQTLSDEGYYTGSCSNEYHAAQVRQKRDAGEADF